MYSERAHRQKAGFSAHGKARKRESLYVISTLAVSEQEGRSRLILRCYVSLQGFSELWSFYSSNPADAAVICLRQLACTNNSSGGETSSSFFSPAASDD